MIYKLYNAVLINRLPQITDEVAAVAYSPAILATETEPAIPEVQAVEAVPRKYTFEACVFIQPEGAPQKEFIQDKNFSFTVTGEKTLAEIEAQLLVEANIFIDTNYNL